MLVSSAGNMGAMQTSALAREVEHFCRTGNPDGLAPMLAELRRVQRAIFRCAQGVAGCKLWAPAPAPESLLRRLAQVDGQLAEMGDQGADIAVVLAQEGDELVALFQ